MLSLLLLFRNLRQGGRLAAVLLWLLLGGAALAQGQAAAPFMVRATPAGGTGLQVGQPQLLTATAVYPAFLSAGFDGPVLATAVQPDGKTLVGGRFTHCGTATRQYLARLNADGTLDASFTLGTELDSAVYALAVQADGRILVGGNFAHFGTPSCGGLARLLPTGALDPTFNSGPNPVSFNGRVRALAVQPVSGRIVVGGEFTSNGNSSFNYLVGLDSNGGFDNTFSGNAHATPFNGPVLALVAQSNGNVLVGGRFLVPRRGIVRLQSTGIPDVAFPTNPTSGPNTGEIAAIAVVGSTIAVGGSFGSYASGGSLQPQPRLALLGNNGELVAGFASPFAAVSNERVYSLALSATQLLVGGAFSVPAATPRTNLVALNATTGALDLSFDERTTFNAPVHSLAQLAGGNVVVGGAFTTYKGGPIRASRIACLLPTGRPNDLDVLVPLSLQPTYKWSSGQTTPSFLTSATGLYWATAAVNGIEQTSNTVALTVAAPTLAPIKVSVAPPGPLTAAAQLTATAAFPALQVGTGFSLAPANPTYRNVWAFQPQANGKLVVVGNFTTYNGTPCQYITRLHADGSRDAAFAYAGLDAVVTVLTIQPDGKIVVSGDFQNYGTTSRHNLARLNTDGSLDGTFAANGTGFSSSAMALIPQPNGKLLVGGNFQNYINPNNSSTTVNFVVRLNADGTRDTDFGPVGTGLSDYVNAMALQPDGKVLVGGAFINYNGTPCQRVARLNPDGSLDTSFVPPTGTSLNGTVEALALQPDGKILVGGRFTDRLIRLNADGSRDLGFTSPSIAPFSSKPGSSPFVATLALQSDGKILVGGEFQGGLLRLGRDGLPDSTFPITGAGFAGKVSTVAVQPDGQVLAGGEFAAYGPDSRNGLARLNATGSLNNADTPVPAGTATYAWSNGSTGSTLWAAASGTYTATASFLSQTALSNAVTLSGTPAPFSVDITPNGPLSLCASTSQLLTARAAVPAGTNVAYTWWQVQAGSQPSPLGVGTPVAASNPAATTLPVNAVGNYYVLATVTSGPLAGTAQSATVSVSEAPTPALTNSVTGLPGTNVVLTGTHLEQVTAVYFGTTPAVFTLNAATAGAAATLTATVPAITANSDILVYTACSTTPSTLQGGFTLPAPTISTAPPLAGARGNAVVVTGTGFVAGGTTATLTSGLVSVSPSVAVTSSEHLTIIVPGGAMIGPNSLVVGTAGGSSNAVSLVVSAAVAPQILASSTLPANNANAGRSLIIPSGVTVTIEGNSTTGNVFTVSRLEVQDGGTLYLRDNVVVASPAGSTGSSFLLASGATLAVGHPDGLGSAAAPGAIQLGSLFFSPDASYEYTGSQPQATGTNLPGQVRSLRSTNSSRLTLSQPVRIARLLAMEGAGHFFLNNQALTLLSDASGTALVVNKDRAGRVLGTATVQRYINPVANTGTGFRYYGAPVKGAKAAVLAAPAFDYDQSRYRPTAVQDTLPLISYGFTTSALVPNAPLEVGRGYRAVVPAATTVQFTGTLTTGDTTITLLRKGKEAYNGWNLVSNPYPAPLNWTKLVAAADTAGLEAAIYVYESAGTNTGSYRSYVNGVSNDKLTNQTANSDLLIAMGQAFFVRVRKGRTTGTLTFRNAHRETSYAQQASFSRTAISAPFKVSAALKKSGTKGGGPTGGCSCHSDRTTIYIDPTLINSVTKPFNSQPFSSTRDADARNLFSFSQQTLSLRGGPNRADSTFAIRAVAPPLASAASPQAVPLVISATSAGVYELEMAVEELAKLGPGFVPYLHDKLHPDPLDKEWTALSGTSAVIYPFNLSAIDILNGVSDRFEIVFNYGVITATAPGVGLSGVAVYPNPTQHRIHVWLPALPAVTQVQATLFNPMGQVVRRQNAPLPATGTALDLDAEGLASGIYILRLQAGTTTTTRRVVLEN